MVRGKIEKLLLSASIPDAHKLTEQLFSRYHTLDAVLCANPYELTDLVGERAAMLIKLAAAAISRMAERHFEHGLYYDEPVMREHLISFFCGSSVELLYLISLDGANKILAVDLIGEGTVNSANVTPRRLLDAAARSRASSVIIAHNHPAGKATPSSEDMIFTDAVENLLQEMGVKLLAHYIVAGNKCKKID